MKNIVLRATTGGKIAHDAANHTYVRSLDNLTFSIKEGERVGLIGHNGSGKSTLLRALAGVYTPTNGSLYTKGRIVSLLDINLGMDVDATGYENIMLRGIMMGMTPKQIEAKTEEIASFTDLGEYLDMPLRSYSSGMQMRLAFTVSTCVDTDILLMDEWLSVGDAEFQTKAAARLNDLVNRTSIIVIATHSPNLVQQVCNRVIQLNHGKIESDKKVSNSKEEES
jgi:lipopolysaccharide transport system ATP-binding protein